MYNCGVVNLSYRPAHGTGLLAHTSHPAPAFRNSSAFTLLPTYAAESRHSPPQSEIRLQAGSFCTLLPPQASACGPWRTEPSAWLHHDSGTASPSSWGSSSKKHFWRCAARQSLLCRVTTLLSCIYLWHCETACNKQSVIKWRLLLMLMSCGDTLTRASRFFAHSLHTTKI